MRTIQRRIEELERKRVEAVAFPSISELNDAQLLAAMARMGDMKECELLWLLGGEPDAEGAVHAFD